MTSNPHKLKSPWSAIISLFFLKFNIYFVKREIERGERGWHFGMAWVVSLGTFQDSCGWWGLLKGCSKRDLNQRQNAFLTIRDLVWNNNALLFLVSFYRSISGFNAGWDKETRHFVKVLKRPASSVRVLMLSRWYSPFKRGYLVEILTPLSRLSHSNLRINEVYREKERKYSCTLHEHQA